MRPSEYKHKVHINAGCAKGDLLVLRGESGMDGDIYLAVWNNNKIKVIAHKKQRDITHVNITDSCILFSTQKPRFQVDHSFYINDFALTKQTKVEYDGLRFLREIEGASCPKTPDGASTAPEVDIEDAERHSKSSTNNDLYVPPSLRKQQ